MPTESDQNLVENATQLKSLVSKRGKLKGQLSRFKSFINSAAQNGATSFEIESRLTNIENAVLEKFDNIHSEIELLLDEDQEEERETFEKLYYKLIGEAKGLLDKMKSCDQRAEVTVSSGVSVNSNSDFHKRVKLPQINLQEFFGNYNQWVTFYDTFNSLINNNAELNNVEKFYYLKSCLKGEAAQVIHSLEVTTDNYTIAWQMLKERYENKKLIIHVHVKGIFELTSVTIESSTHLRKLLDGFNKNLRALTALGQPTEQWDTLLIYILASKLDPTTKRGYEESVNNDNTPSILTLTDFIAKRCILLETLEGKTKALTKVIKPQSGESFRNQKSFVHLTSSKISCTFCKEPHLNFTCDKLITLSIPERRQEIKKHKLCSNCLRPGHWQKNCKSSGCKICGGRHNSLLHPSENTINFNPSIQENLNGILETSKPFALSEGSTTEPVIVAHSSKHIQGVLLATANVFMVNSAGQLISCRALLDGGSMSNFITTSFAKKLNLKIIDTLIPIAGINNSTSNISCKIEATVYSQNLKYNNQDTFLLVDQITGNMPQFSFEVPSVLEIPRNIKLADPKFNEAQPVDLLLGASIFYEILCIGQIKTGSNKPILQKTRLGWLVTGPINLTPIHPLACNFLISNEVLHDQLESFWKLEDCERLNKTHLSLEESECENHFISNYKRDDSGRFIVSLPFKDNITELGESEQMATKRFYHLETKFKRNENLKKLYINFMKEYENLGHMTKLNEINRNTAHYYMPHHGVFKETSITTKLRVVFDASAQSTSGLSLNNALKVGPVLQRDLFSILLKFREHNVVITADIEKMYRQVLIEDKHRDYQRIIWRENPDQVLGHYKLNTVSYGTASASFLAVRSLMQAASDHEITFPEAVKIIKRDFYMDDLITGADSIENALKLKNQITKILESACLPLRKWRSNKNMRTNDEFEDVVNTNYIISDDNKAIKTLGVEWNSNSDSFSYSVNCINVPDTVTKRTILSTISSIFDPLGLVAPITTRAKLIMQALWQARVDWDTSLDNHIHTAWLQFYEQLQFINRMHIPRQVTVPEFVEIQLHGFCDASQQAYGACIYVRTKDKFGNYCSNLLCAKSRVAPLKTISLPRLELCGALLLTQLMNKVENALNLETKDRFFWCDSTITLSWIAAEPMMWKTFVANRVSEIQTNSSKFEWNHIDSKGNPADAVSRGVNSQQLIDDNLWWHGPDFLTKHQNAWPTRHTQNNTSKVDMEKRKEVILSFHSNIDSTIILDRFSSYSKMLRVFAFLLRFVNNSNPKIKEKLTGNLSCIEFNKALTSLVRVIQSSYFQREIDCLSKGKPISSTSRLLTLNVFLDEERLLRVGGRLKNSDQQFDKKFPFILPSNTKLVQLIIEHEHKRLFHAGPNTVLASVRNKFWLLNGKNAVKKVIRKCVICFKTHPVNKTPLMGNLPRARVTQTRPFNTIGIDFAGPILVKDGTLRNRKLVKNYLCIFVCFVTKAVHLELTSDLSTEIFLNTLKRFVARRGLCKVIYTDNGTNFVGANNELKRFVAWVRETCKNETIRNFLLNHEITWHFSPPKSPHFGGLWEAAVKSAKRHLIRVVGNAHLTYEQLYTVLCQIEGILNSRPLTGMSDDPNDFAALTPGHFLIGTALTALPEQYPDGETINRLKGYQRLQAMMSHFWHRWTSEYLTSLQQRYKWKTAVGDQFKIGSLVIIKEDNTPVLHWRLGKIEALHKGEDNIVRVVSVKTSSGLIKRSVGKVFVLPIDNA